MDRVEMEDRIEALEAELDEMRRKPNHLMHFILTIITGGAWFPVWFFVTFPLTAAVILTLLIVLFVVSMLAY